MEFCSFGRRKLRTGTEEEAGMKTVLTIAGSDSGGGAGIQADIKTLTMQGVYAMTAVTALTAQNTLGVSGISEVTPEFLREQLDCVFSDIFPDAVKIGMLSGTGLVRAAAERLRYYGAKHIVLDPVMVSTSGSRLMQKETVSDLKEELFPLAELITPNIPEAEALAGVRIRSQKDMEKAAEALHETWGCSVLCKGGHLPDSADDLLYTKGGAFWIRGNRIANQNTHGTGCTLSSAIAGNLALGFPLQEAVCWAKEYLTGALQDGLDLGKGSGPLNHMYRLCPKGVLN